MSAAVHRRYEQVLRLYPADYRRERGAEMLSTLMEGVAPDQRRPALREVASLVAGALRARAGAGAFDSPARLWWSALRLAALLLFAHAAAQSAAHAGRVIFSEVLQGRGLALPSDSGHVAAFAAASAALVAVAAGRHRTALLLGGVAFAAGQWAASWTPPAVRLADDELWVPLVALVVTLPLTGRPSAHNRRPWLWLIAVPLAALLLPTDADASLGLQPYALVVVCTVLLAGAVADARLAVAAAALVAGPILSLLGYYHPMWVNGRSENLFLLCGYAALAVAGAALGALLVRRQTRV